jgi:hypothetical protein
LDPAAESVRNRLANKPAALMTCFALLSIYAMYLGRETRADPLLR